MSEHRKYTVDTNLVIDAARDQVANEALARFHRENAPFEYLSSIVVQELRSGARSAHDLRRLEADFLDLFDRAGRVFTPSRRAWSLSGDVLRDLARRDGLELAKVPKSLGNDIMLALSCREAGVILVTRNESDFARIRRVVEFAFVAPWP
jgi:predicted nucleic acid-binding protein